MTDLAQDFFGPKQTRQLAYHFPFTAPLAQMHVFGFGADPSGC